MPAFDLISLAILWCIGFLALIQTINAKGAIRAAMSGIVTVIILLIASFFSYLKFEGYGTFVSPELSPKAIIAANIAANEAMFKERATDSTQAAGVSSESVRSNASSTLDAMNSLDHYIVQSEKIVNDALALADQISKIKALPNDISEPNREKAESKALALRNSTAKINGRATSLFHPRKVSELHRLLVRATENLRLAGYALHAYTTLESAADRTAQFEQSKRQAAAAIEALKAFTVEIGKIQNK